MADEPRRRYRRPFRAAGIPVVVGGFHVSGCIAMLPELPPDLKEALDLGITLFAGEAEGRMAGLFRTSSFKSTRTGSRARAGRRTS